MNKFAVFVLLTVLLSLPFTASADVLDPPGGWCINSDGSSSTLPWCIPIPDSYPEPAGIETILP
jgi:hypothetical protein